ncbi:MAG: RIP metalloprotease [Desulfovibrionaceae bacterium]
MISTIAVVLVLGGLIFFHELGHFLVARIQGIGVKAFSLGFGPEIWGTTRGRTRYKLSVIPLGGFVSLAGESPDGEDDDWPREMRFMDRPPMHRLLVVLAGPMFNFVLGWLLYWAIFVGMGHVPIVEYDIQEIIPGSPAVEAGLLPGDVITLVDGDISYTPDTLLLGVLFSQQDPMTLTVRRGDSSFETVITPAFLSEADRNDELLPRPKIGVAYNPVLVERPLGPTLGALAGLDKCGDVIVQTAKSILLIVEGKASLKGVGGPIMIVQEVGARAKSGLVDVLLMAAFISINLGILNLLPIPVLDGGHIFFFTWEALTRRPVNEEFRRWATYAGMSLLLALMLLAFYNDISRWFAA